jgi:hypothetical protein
MTTDDTHPAETPSDPPSEPADDALSKRTVEWWKRRSRVEKALIVAGIVIAAVFAWHVLAGGDSAPKDADVSSDVKSSMQQTLDTDSRFAQYHLVVDKVDVVRQTGNQYQGLATVRSPKGIDHQVGIQVTDDGKNIIWQSNPGAFAWMVLEQLNPAAPTKTGFPQ